MMSGASAVKVALDLLHLPSRVRVYRSEPLPPDVVTLLRIASGDEAAAVAAATAVERPRELVRSASAFFIEQILLAPDSDSYRLLGADRNASATDLRRNMALLLKGLHPDIDRKGDRSIFAGRVTSAWENLKTKDRRAAYDRTKLVYEPKVNSARAHRKRRHRRPALGGKFGIMPPPRMGFLRRALWLLMRGARI